MKKRIREYYKKQQNQRTHSKSIWNILNISTLASILSSTSYRFERMDKMPINLESTSDYAVALYDEPFTILTDLKSVSTYI